MTNRKEALASVAAEIEQHLTVVGGTANEDKLQDGVPACVANLVSADIKVREAVCVCVCVCVC